MGIPREYRKRRARARRSTATSSLTLKQGTAFVLVTHDATLAARCTRQLHLVLGQLAGGI